MKGVLSVSVPGLVDGWLMAHRPFGKLGLLEVLTPAIELCEQGFPVSHKLAEILHAEHEHFSSDPYARAIFEPDGRPLDPGQLLFQRELGQTLRIIAAEGRAAFYEGEIAREIARFMGEHDGLVTFDDLAGFNARLDEPIYVDYYGHRIYEMPPNSSGHILLQELNLIEQFDIPSMGCLTPESVHIMVEAKKLAFADREAHMADPDFRDVPIERLLSKAYAEERAALIDPNRVNTKVTTGIVETTEDTTCFTVADGEGNVVCALQSIQSSLGSSMIAGNTGILLNNRMTYWHWPKPRKWLYLSWVILFRLLHTWICKFAARKWDCLVTLNTGYPSQQSSPVRLDCNRIDLEGSVPLHIPMATTYLLHLWKSFLPIENVICIL